MQILFIKELKLYIQDKKSVIFTFLLPMVLISIFAFTFGGANTSRQRINPIELLIVDLDKTSTSQRIIAHLDSLKSVRVKFGIPNPEELVKKGDYVALLILHKGLSIAVETLSPLPLELKYDRSREMEIGILISILDSGVKQFLASENSHTRSSLEVQQIETAQKLRLTSIVGERKKANPGLIQAVSGTAILMLMFSVSGLGSSILQEKEKGTLRRLLYAPLKKSTILKSKMLFAFFIALLQLSVMFIFSWLVFGLDLLINLPALIIMIVATGFAISSFGVFLAAISKTRAQAQSFGTLVILVMSSLGGSIVPLFIMPEVMKKLALLSVNYWGIQGFFDIFWRELPTIEILPRVGVLIAIGLFLSIISFRLFNKTIDKMV